MTNKGNRLWNSLEKWSATVFLIAGGLALFGTVLSVVGELMSVSVQAPSSLAVFTGVVLSFVALLGFYPRLASQAPRLAQVGVLLIVSPLLFSFVLLIWHSPELVGVHVPTLLAFLPSPVLVYEAFFVLSAIGITIFSIGSLSTDVSTPVVSGLLFALAASWFFLIGAASVYGFPIPNWVANVQGGLMGLALVAIGYLLRIETAPIDGADPASDTTAG